MDRLVDTSYSRDIRILAMAVFVDMFAFALILPGLPFAAMEMGATGLWLGALLTAYSAAKLVGATLAGRVSDRFGRRPVLMVCLLGSGVSFLFTGLAGTLVALAVARAVAGAFGGTVATAQAYVADVSRPASRARYMGLIGASIGSGFIVGPLLGVALGPLGFPTVAFLGAAIATVNGLWLGFRLRESPRRRRLATGESAVVDDDAPRGLERSGSLLILAAAFGTMFAFVSMETTLAFVARDVYALGQTGFGMILVWVGLVMIVVQGGLIGRLAARYGERTLATIGAALLGGALLLLPIAGTLPAAIGILGILAFGQGLASPSLATLLSRHALRDEQGGMLGIGQSVSAAARALAPVTAGWLYDQGMSWPFLLAGLLGLAAAGAVARIGRPAEASAGAR